MNKLLLSILILLNINIFGLSAEQEFKNQVQGKTIIGKSIKGRQALYTFSQNGNNALLRQGGTFNHEFIKMCGDIAIYKEYRLFDVYYTAFQVNGDKVYVTSNDVVGGLKLEKYKDIPQQVAQKLLNNALIFLFK